MVSPTPLQREAEAILALLFTPGVGRAAVAEVMEASRRARRPVAELLGVPGPEVAAVFAGAGGAAAEAVVRCRDEDRHEARRQLRALLDAGGVALVSGWEGYPARLAEALGRQTPPLLLTLGDLALFQRPAAAVVGTRKPGSTGAAVAERAAACVARAGRVVVSGGAEGVDAIAHRAVLDAGGATVVVLPCGLSRRVLEASVERGREDGRTLVVSEFAFDQEWQTHAAVTRNATIAALASAVAVVEPRRTGGSMRTADHALTQGKPVLVHTASDQRQVMAYFEARGALPLTDPAGALREDALQAALTAEAIPRPPQGELF